MLVGGRYTDILVERFPRNNPFYETLLLKKKSNFSNATGGKCLPLPQTGYGPEYVIRYKAAVIELTINVDLVYF